MENNHTIDVAKKNAEEMLRLMGLDGKVSIEENKESESLVVAIETENPGILIGRHGETMEAFQLILSQIIFKQTGQWHKIAVDTEGYRQKQADSLKNMAQDAAEKVKQTGSPQPLYDLTANQRRIVHTILADDPQVVTESEGEGRERHLVVKPRG